MKKAIVSIAMLTIPVVSFGYISVPIAQPQFKIKYVESFQYDPKTYEPQISTPTGHIDNPCPLFQSTDLSSKVSVSLFTDEGGENYCLQIENNDYQKLVQKGGENSVISLKEATDAIERATFVAPIPIIDPLL